jgi:hypothetical protein
VIPCFELFEKPHEVISKTYKEHFMFARAIFSSTSLA